MTPKRANTLTFPPTAATPRAYRGPLLEFTRWVAIIYLKLTGWTIKGSFPDVPRAVVIAAPHTSNWDGFTMLASAAYFRVRFSWLGKKALTDGPFGWLLRAIGCIGVDRKSKNDAVSVMAEAFAREPKLMLAVAPEGTRSKTRRWRSGFYHIAREANVPIIISILDYGTKTITLPALIHPSGDYESDLAWIQSHYEGVRGKYGEKFKAQG